MSFLGKRTSRMSQVKGNDGRIQSLFLSPRYPIYSHQSPAQPILCRGVHVQAKTLRSTPTIQLYSITSSVLERNVPGPPLIPTFVGHNKLQSSSPSYSTLLHPHRRQINVQYIYIKRAARPTSASQTHYILFEFQTELGATCWSVSFNTPPPITSPSLVLLT